MHKIKILQFTVASSMGGRTRYILNVWQGISKERFQFDFVTFSDKNSFPIDFNIEGGTVYYLKNYPEKNREAFIEEFLEILENGYDAIEIHTSYWKDTIVEELAKEVGIPRIIIHGHSTGITQISASNVSEENTLKKRHELIKNQLNNNIATDFWACSEMCADWLFRPYISEERIRIVPNFIDTERFKYDDKKRQIVRKKIGVTNEVVYGFVGRLEPVKNLMFLINAFSAVSHKNKNTKLVIVGNGSLLHQLKQCVQALDIEKKVIFLGNRADIEWWYQGMDCFLMPSIFEGFPISALEAQCSGLKCLLSDRITSDICLSEKVKLIPIESEDSWIREMLKIKNENYNRQYSEKILIEKGFDISESIQKLEQLYR